MRRKGFLFEQICSYQNLLLATYNASKGKKQRDEVIKFEADLDNNLRQLQAELQSRTYTTSEYTVFVKYEPKRREIYKLPYRDRVVQWAIMQVLEPLWTPTFTADTYACIKGRGIHSLLKKIRKDLRDDPDGTRYCFKLDVRKFYPSINHDILKVVIRRKIKDPDVLWLLDDIIDSADGVPIGNYISQYFANLYLSELDHLIREFLGVRYYYRYADDIVILSESKQFLSGVMVFVNDYLINDRLLDMKRNYQIFPVDARGIDFIGYVIYRTHCLARKRNKKALCREVSKMRKRGIADDDIRLALASRLGFMVHCDSKHLINILGMKKFSDIKPKQGRLTGGKYHIDTILNREIHLTGFDISQSKYDGDMLTLQYEIYEDLEDEQGKVIDDDGNPVKGWVKHITFTGSKALMRQLDGVDLTEPVAAKIIKQPIGSDGRRCFYSIVDPDQ